MRRRPGARALTAAALLLPLALVGVVVLAVPGTAGPPSAARPVVRCLDGSTDPARPLVVRTIPALPSAGLRLDGRALQSTAPGVFVASGLCAADAPERLAAPEVVHVRPDVRQRLSRWVTSRRAGEVTVVYDVERRVSFDFARLDGRPVPLADLEDVVVKSSTGGVVHPRERTVWLQSERVVPTPDGLRVKELYYTIDDVRAAGTSVVHRAQQRFTPAQENRAVVQLLYFPVRVSTRDTLFGHPVGTAVLLTHPSGRVTRHALDARGELQLEPLPRGDYTVQAVAPGPVVVHHLALSRPQEVDLAVLTWLDVAVLLGTGASIAVVLLVARRPHLRRPHRLLARAVRSALSSTERAETDGAAARAPRRDGGRHVRRPGVPQQRRPGEQAPAAPVAASATGWPVAAHPPHAGHRRTALGWPESDRSPAEAGR